MCVIRRMDAVLEPTKQAVLDTKKMLDKAGITEQRAALCDAAGQAFYNTSRSPCATSSPAAASSSSWPISRTT
jgi:type I restriction-modification system DNA methylase subunit